MSTGQISDGRARRARIGTATCFLLTGFIFATFASRVPAVKENLGLTNGQLAIGFVGLNAGAILGLQLGGMLVPRTGSRPALAVALLAFAGVLLLPAIVPNLPTLVAALLLLAVFNSVVDVAMNAQGVTGQKLMGRPVLSGMHAMHSLGGVLGAGAGALAAHLDAGPPLHFLTTTGVAGIASLAVSPLLLPSREDAEDGPSVDGNGTVVADISEWFRGWSLPMAVIGALAFCFTLAEGAALDWSAVYVSDSLGGSASLSAVGLGVFLGAVTLGRLAGDRLVSRFGAVRVFWVGAVTAGAGFGSALLINTPPAGVVGLGLLGAGIANALPLAIGAAGNAPGEAPATAAARVSTFAYLGSFVGPALIGALATVWRLPLALALPAVLVLATAFGARAVRRAG
ncbi:MAG: MFS transporter [Actinomycetota bacterium]|nr:MFS transporter [Actinomycetota bacterium]